MKTGWRWKRVAVGAIGLALGMTACATVGPPSTESLLSQAGFRQAPADTAAKIAHLQTLPDRKLVARKYKDKTYYVYSDPTGCKCLYVGNDAQYQSYRNIVKQQQQANQQWEPQGGVAEAREWEIENSGLQ